MNIKLKSLVQALKQSNNEELDKELIQAIFAEMCALIEKGQHESLAPEGNPRNWPTRLIRTASLVGTELAKHELVGETLKVIKEAIKNFFG